MNPPGLFIDFLKAPSKRFSPTRLATTLTSSAAPLPTTSGVGSTTQSQGFIVLETNYRIYAYTGICIVISLEEY